MPSVSAKQAKLMSAIAHGWDPPMKHAPSMAVAEDFHSADKKQGKFMHADGGKVGNLRRLSDYVESMMHGYHSTNSPRYMNLLNRHDWNPKVTPTDAEALKVLAQGSYSEEAQPTADDIRELFDKYSMTLNAPTKTFRGIANYQIPDASSLYTPGSVLKSDKPQSTSLERLVAKSFTENHDDVSLWSILNPAGHKLLPNPLSGESELMLPAGDQGALNVLRRSTVPPQRDSDPDETWNVLTQRKADGGKVSAAKAALQAIRDALPSAKEKLARVGSQLSDQGVDPYNTADAIAARAARAAESDDFIPGVIHPEMSWADGGAVGDTPSSTENYLGLIRHAADRASAAVSDDPHHALARVAAGLASQVTGLSPSGHAELGRRPGVINETLSLPAGLTDMGEGALRILGGGKGETGPGGAKMSSMDDWFDSLHAKYGDLAPGWSRDAEAKTGQLHKATDKAMGLGDAHGLVENLAEAGGTMLGQIPIGGTKAELSGARALASKLFKSPAEWLGPTIRPSLANYGAGTLFGGLAGAAGGSPAASPPSADATTPNKEQFQ